MVTIRQYFGFMNGTLSEKSSESKNSGGARHRKTYFNNRSKSNGVNKHTKKIVKKMESIKTK